MDIEAVLAQARSTQEQWPEAETSLQQLIEGDWSVAVKSSEVVYGF